MSCIYEFLTSAKKQGNLQVQPHPVCSSPPREGDLQRKQVTVPQYSPGSYFVCKSASESMEKPILNEDSEEGS